MPSLTEVVAGRPEVVGETIDGDLASGERLEGVTFVGCRLTGSLARSVIAGCRFERCTVEQVDLSGARLPDTVLDACTFVEVRALGTVWGSLARPTIPPDPSTWTDCRLDLGAFGGADLSGARFERCSFVEADLDGLCCAVRGSTAVICAAPASSGATCVRRTSGGATATSSTRGRTRSPA